MNWYSRNIFSGTNYYQARNAFTPEFNKILNDAALESARNMGKMSPKTVATVKDVFIPKLLEKIPEIVWDIPIIFASNVNGDHFNGFAAGVDSLGNKVIVMHPEQAYADYVTGILHEIHHMVERLNGKKMTNTHQLMKDKGYRAYWNHPSEQRARGGEKLFDNVDEDEGTEQI